VTGRPLEGFVVGITADRRWAEQADLLGRRGAEVIHGPSIATAFLADDATLRTATVDLIEQPPDYRGGSRISMSSLLLTVSGKVLEPFDGMVALATVPRH
jgi:hypothetical protein